MDSKELVKLLNVSLKEQGFTKSQKDTWIFEMQEVCIVVKIRTSSWSSHFYIDLGVVFVKLFQNKELKKISIDDSHIGHGLYNLLLEFGESQEYLEKLFSYGFAESEIASNVKAIFELLLGKVIPYFEKFNDYKYLDQNFKDNIAFKPFFVYFEPPEFYSSFFKEQLGNVSK